MDVYWSLLVLKVMMMSGPTVHSYEKQSSRGRLLESSGTKSMMGGPTVHSYEKQSSVDVTWTFTGVFWY